MTKFWARADCAMAPKAKTTAINMLIFFMMMLLFSNVTVVVVGDQFCVVIRNCSRACERLF
jgi:hypothetical protein